MSTHRNSTSLSPLVMVVGISLILGVHWPILAQDGTAGATSADGVAAATSYSEPPEVSSYEAEREDQFISNTRQLITDSLRTGEGYFSAD